LKMPCRITSSLLTVRGLTFPAILGYYSSDDQAVADAHIRALDYGKVEVAIASWWGPNQHTEQARIPLLMDRTAAFGSRIKWTLHYEKEGGANPPGALPRQVLRDLARLLARGRGRPTTCPRPRPLRPKRARHGGLRQVLADRHQLQRVGRGNVRRARLGVGQRLGLRYLPRHTPQRRQCKYSRS
jgi:hypothetical protein